MPEMSAADALSPERVAERRKARRGKTSPIRIRAGSGLGDAIYLQAIVRHLVLSGVEDIEVCTDWPDVFRPIERYIRRSRFRRDNVNRIAHYTCARDCKETDQFEDMCLMAGIKEPVDLALDWTLSAPAVEFGHAYRPLILVALPREPFARGDHFGLPLFPDCRRLQQIVDRLRQRGAGVVQVGAGEALYALDGLTENLANTTTVAQLLDIAAAADGFVGQPGFFIPLAESFSAPGLFLWARAGLRHAHPSLSSITPHKLFHRKDRMRAIIDDDSDFQLEQITDAFFDQVGNRCAV